MALTNRVKNYIRKNHARSSAKDIAQKFNLEEQEVQDFIDEIAMPLSAKKKALFYGITLSVPLLFFIILEITLRSINYKGETKLFLDPKIPTDNYYITNPDFASRYFFYTKTIPNPSTDVFLQQKPENAYRVFAMGGSSAAGYPYGFNGTYSRMVNDVLSDAMPNREVEVINVATSAISTYTLYDQVDEILEQQPDAITIYTGHNEFYGALGVGSNETLGAFPAFVRFYLKLQRYKTFLLLREVIVDTGQWLSSTVGGEKLATGTLMERIIKDQSIELNGPVYELAMTQFKSNMMAIIQKFEEANVPVYLSTIGSNEKDQAPFVSISGIDLPAADSVYQDAQQLLENGDSLKAKSQYVYAKDLDGLKFRAPDQINAIIRDLANEYKNVHLVHTYQAFEENSPAGIIGNDLMLEHLHPNQTGYYLMGRSFSEQILRDLKSKGATDVDLNDWNFDPYFEKMYITEIDNEIVKHRILTLKQGFPFVVGNEVRPYQLSYDPEDVIDSLAFAVVHQDLNWDVAKVKAAEFYENERQIERAIREYRGLIRNQPWNDSPYIFAARLYLDQNKLKEAEPLLRKAYEIFPNEAFTTKMLGAIELNNNNLQEAIKLLEESRSLNARDPQMLYNLSGAYGKNRDFDKALNIAREVYDINPNFPGLTSWINQLNNIIQSSRQ